jgi:putative ABC transport system substrate-binding protein
MKRRSFITLLGGAVMGASSLDALAQPKERRVGVRIGTDENDPETKLRVEALLQGLRDAGWVADRNIHLDFRFSRGDAERMQRYAREIVGLGPDVIVVHSNDFLSALLQTDRRILKVFVQVGDPVGSGFVESLAHPGGSLTGFTAFEAEIGGKWLQTLKEIAPALTRTLVLFHERIRAHQAFLSAARTAAASMGVTATAAALQDGADFERVIGPFAGAPGGSLIVLPSPLAAVNRDRITGLAAKYRLPAIYAYRFFAASGGLLAYGVDTRDLYRRAASYVDRILRGAKPSDLPVQQPTKYELVINLQTAKAMEPAVSPALLARADEVIE